MYTIQNKIYGFIHTLPITLLSSNSFKASRVSSIEYILVLSSRGAEEEQDETNSTAKLMNIFLYIKFIMPFLRLKYI